MFREEDLEVGRRAIERQWISQAQMEESLREVQNGTVSLADALVRRGLLTTAQVLEVLREIHPPTRSLSPGESFGKYRIVREIGRGGMGIVYEAVDEDLDRRVALKVLSQKLLPSNDDAERFVREARLAAKLRHPNLVTVHDVGLVDDSPFFTMDLIEARTLDRVIEDPAVDLRARVEILRKVAQAVQAAHESNIIHRDLKPANILIDGKLEPHVTDFGLARDLGSETVLTQSGMAMGTPSYMAPEQAMGLRDAMDARTDVYSLGVILYQALTLRLPFLEESMSAVLLKVTTEEPEPPRKHDSTIDRGLELVCLKAMSRERMRRYENAGQLAEDLGRWLRGEPVTARPPGMVDSLQRRVRRHPAFSAAAVVGFCALLAFGVFLYYRPAKLKIQNPGNARIEIDGQERRELEISLKRGLHRVRARLDGFREFAVDVDLGPGEVRTLDVRMEPRSGVLDFAGMASGTHLTLWGDDGLHEYVTPRAPLSLREGRYTALVWAPGTMMVVKDYAIHDRQTTAASVELPGAVVWDYETRNRIDRDPLVVDLDGDGRSEVVVVSQDRHVRVFGESGKLAWSFETKEESHTDLAAGQFDGSTHLLLGVGTEGFLALRLWRESLLPRFFRKTRSRAYVVPVGEQLLVTDWSGDLSLLSARKLVAQEEGVIWSRSAMAQIEGPALVGDLDADAVVDVAVTTHGPEVVFFGLEDGKDKGRVALPAAPSSASTLVDVNGDLGCEVIVALKDASVVCVSAREKRILWRWAGARPARTKPLAIDLDGDLEIDVLAGCEDGLVCLDGRSGAFRWKFLTEGPVRGTPAAADVEGDGKFEVVFGSGDGRLLAVDSRGNLVWFFRAGGGVTCGPAIVNRDGLEFVFGSADNQLTAVRVRPRSKR